MKIKLLGLTLATALIVGGITTTCSVSANSRVKVVKVNKIKARTMFSTGGNIYTSRYLKKVAHKGYNYPRTKWKVNLSVKVKKSNHKSAVYYYIANKNNGIKGWIWRGYLANKPDYKEAQANKKAANKTTTKNGVKIRNGVAVLPKTNKIHHNYKGSSAVNHKKFLSLNVPVSNTNVYGYKHLNTYRKDLLKFKNFDKNWKQENSDYQSYYLLYENIVSGNVAVLNSVPQNSIDTNIKSMEYTFAHSDEN